MLDKTDGFMPKNCMSGYDFESGQREMTMVLTLLRHWEKGEVT